MHENSHSISLSSSRHTILRRPTPRDLLMAGICLAEYQSAAHAKTAVEVLQGYKFDKSHALTVTSLEKAREQRGDGGFVFVGCFW